MSKSKDIGHFRSPDFEKNLKIGFVQGPR